MRDGSLDGLEDRVSKDREALAQSLETLARTFSPQHFGRTVEEYGTQVTRTVTDRARENPAALALVGAGIALLLTGAGRRTDAEALEAPAGMGALPASGAEARVGPPDAPGDPQPGVTPRLPEDRQRPSAARLRAMMDHGLDQLSPAARNRVRKARQRVVDAQEAVERRARKAAGASSSFVRQQPIAAGALAFGCGAIAAALLPGTRTEDRLMGQRRDALMAEASLAFEREMENARAELRKRTGQEP